MDYQEVDDYLKRLEREINAAIERQKGSYQPPRENEV